MPLLRDAIPDAIFYRVHYFRKYKCLPSFRKPAKFSEKILKRMRYPHPEFSTLADKYLMREYVSQKIGTQYLPRNYLVTENLTRDEYDRLPNSFVMKATHSSGDVLVVKNKADFSFESLRSKSQAWMSRSFASKKREKHYRAIQPKIVVEELLSNGGQAPDEYKIYTYRDDLGQVRQIIRYITEQPAGRLQSTHLPDWSLAGFEYAKAKAPDVLPQRPENLDQVLEMTEKLLGQHNFIRIDFYIIGNDVYVGELTFTPASGKYSFEDKAVDYYLGSIFGDS